LDLTSYRVSPIDVFSDRSSEGTKFIWLVRPYHYATPAQADGFCERSVGTPVQGTNQAAALRTMMLTFIVVTNGGITTLLYQCKLKGGR
jgi:hypothetical protein